MHGRTALILSLLLLSTGCVQRTLTVNSDPPGALVYLNGVEVGRTPLTRDFTWYGTYDVVLRKEGFETLKTTGKVIAPWWQWVPIDLFAEMLPLHDKRHLDYTMEPTPPIAVDPEQMIRRAEAMRPELEGSEHTRNPASKPTSKPATKPTTKTVD